MDDKRWMKRAIDLARNGIGTTSPNPLVGAVLVDDEGNVVGEGWHHKAGEPHAEVNALAQAGEKARGTTAYVTLEPCSHYGRTGPCCEALIAAGVKKVVIAIGDPNPKVAGNGIRRLQEEGIEVNVGVLAKEAAEVNEVFLHWITTNRPFVALKYAMTLDGKIATGTGDSKWITGEEARAHAHYLRSIYDAILVGKGTVLADNPSLTCRFVEGKNPIRIILDAKLEIPISAKVISDGEAKTIIVAGKDVLPERLAERKCLDNVEVLQVDTTDGNVDLDELLITLSERKITSILVEGGGAVHGNFFDAGFVDRVYAFIAPRLIGGKKSLSPIGGIGCLKIADGIQLDRVETMVLGSDFLITGCMAKG
ncbi:MAG: bifunctional diaminohydroxyphosphoribosylaminopyrimidine deaminase/5-amino-6-(5-phosphoribosylamino)uracil reductase RibD [Acholeplasmataceae bacterium]|nr:bifunctional diaminohydroxyphosphoribosylaminopyrimidine deaminase/5-amino-6-(5-phosphoribosylamino)uracil reductase RibD [Acholeplasmataceae bacterium]